MKRKNQSQPVKHKKTTTSFSLTPNELAEKWGVATGTLANWRAKRVGPKFFKAGRKVLYREVDISSFEIKNLVK